MVTEIANLLTLDEVMAQLKMSRTSIYRLMTEYGFPRPLKIGGRTNRWRQEDVAEWLDRQPKGARGSVT